MLGRWEAFLTPNLLAVTQGSLGRPDSRARRQRRRRLRTDLLNINVWGSASADRGGLALRIHHRQSVALWPRQLSRRASLWRTGAARLGPWSAACQSWLRASATTQMQPACCAIRPAPITTPASKTLPPTRWPSRIRFEWPVGPDESAQLRSNRQSMARLDGNNSRPRLSALLLLLLADHGPTQLVA